MAALWVWLGKRNREPSTPIKFSLALMFVGLGFLVLMWATTTLDWGLSLVIARDRWDFWGTKKTIPPPAERSPQIPRSRRQRTALALSVLSNLCALGFFKGYFFAQNPQSFGDKFAPWNWRCHLFALRQRRRRIIQNRLYLVIGFKIGVGLKPAMTAIGTLNIAPLKGDGRGANLVFSVTVRALQAHGLPNPMGYRFANSINLLRALKAPEPSAPSFVKRASRCAMHH
jgi:hypothetical protein